VGAFDLDISKPIPSGFEIEFGGPGGWRTDRSQLVCRVRQRPRCASRNDRS
jgi:hypothetical protein